MPQAIILIIDAERSERLRLSQLLTADGFDVHTAGTAKEGLTLLERHAPSLVIFDEEVKGLTPEALLRVIQARDLSTFTLITTRNPASDRALDWILGGAFAFLPKPVPPRRLLAVIHRGLENQAAYHDVVDLAERLNDANAALTRERESLRFLYELARNLSSALSVGRVAAVTGEALIGSPETDVVAFLTTGTGKGPRLHLSRPLPAPEAHRLIRELAALLPDAEADRPVTLDCETRDDAAGLPPHRRILPLMAGGYRLGGLAVCYHHDPDTLPGQRLLLDNLAATTGLAVQSALQHERALELAAHDGLTGLLNRRSFDEVLEREYRRHERYRSHMSMIMMDLDHFKTVNDTYGHKTGDDVLRLVADCLRETARATDLIARYGGEEFAVLLPNAGRSEAAGLARRIQRALARLDIPAGRAVIHQTVSQGIAGTDRDSTANPEDLVRIADKALYRAKNAGRDTIRPRDPGIDPAPERIPLPSSSEEACHVR